MSNDLILKVEGVVPSNVVLSDLEGKTFQIHRLSGNRIRLYPISVRHDGQCTIMLKGERCGKAAGHEGKHCWGNGD